MSARIDPKRILILGQQVGRMDAWNAFGRTRGTAANCGIRCARTRHWGRRQIVGCNAPNMIMWQLARKRYVPSGSGFDELLVRSRRIFDQFVLQNPLNPGFSSEAGNREITFFCSAVKTSVFWTSTARFRTASSRRAIETPPTKSRFSPLCGQDCIVWFRAACLSL